MWECVDFCWHFVETFLTDLVAAVVVSGLQERAFPAVGAKSSVFQLLQDCFDVGEMVVIVDSSSDDVVEDTVRV